MRASGNVFAALEEALKRLAFLKCVLDSIVQDVPDAPDVVVDDLEVAEGFQNVRG